MLRDELTEYVGENLEPKLVSYKKNASGHAYHAEIRQIPKSTEEIVEDPMGIFLRIISEAHKKG